MEDVGTGEEGAGVSCVGDDDSGTVELEELTLDVDGEGGATDELKLSMKEVGTGEGVGVSCVGDDELTPVIAEVDVVGITADCDGGGSGGGGGGSGSVVTLGEGDGSMEESIVITGVADDVDVWKGKELDGTGREIEELSSGDVGEDSWGDCKTEVAGEGDGEGVSDGCVTTGEDETGG